MTTSRLLLVDDEELFVRGLGREMERLGWRVQTAANTEAALRALRQGEFEALVVDLQMPGPNGLHVLAELGRLLVRPVAVLLSGYLNVASTVRAVQDGADDVLEKPVSAGDLDARLRELLAARDASPRGVSAALGGAGELAKVLGEAASIRAVREQIRTAARYPELCLTIFGESGTGKEQVARAIHALANPSDKYLPVSLASVPEHLVEIELFGSEGEPGHEARVGLFELAGSGTLFISELMELPPSLHPKLLSALETRTFRRAFGDVDLPLAARIIVATRRRTPGPEYVELCERLATFSIQLPALRDRIADIELIARNVLSALAAETNRAAPLTLSPSALEVLAAHTWPGNVRELQIVVGEAAAVAQGSALGAEDVRGAIRDHGMPADSETASENASGTFLTSAAVSEPLRTLERRMITDAWQTSGRNLSAAARTLGLPRTTLRDRLKKYGLR